MQLICFRGSLLLLSSRLVGDKCVASGEEGLVVCLWCACGSFVSFYPGHHTLWDITLSFTKFRHHFCHRLMMAAVHWALTPHPCTEHTNFPLCMWIHDPHSIPHKGKLRSNNLCKVTHGRADCLTLHTKWEASGTRTGGYGKNWCQVERGDRRPRRHTGSGHCRAALASLSFMACDL